MMGQFPSVKEAKKKEKGAKTNKKRGFNPILVIPVINP